MMQNDHTIIAQSTPSGLGAIALIRLSGAQALSIADNISKLPRSRILQDQPSHTINYGWVVGKEGQHIDQVLFAVMHAPHTFTGEETVEITCHNNPFIIQEIIQEAIAHGARQAAPGEFTRRAFENNKLDLTQAEAINDLLCAQTQTALKKSLAQLEGSLSYWLRDIEKQLIRSLAWCEASFEFLEDEGDFGSQIKDQMTDIVAKVNQAKASFDISQQIRQGFRIALLGSVNTGKSSLFNYLLNQPRAIVTDIAGTTRDAIEAGMYHQGNHWTLIDTAGLRITHDIVEKEGIKRSFNEAEKADIVLLVLDQSQQLTNEEQIVYKDLLKKYPSKTILIATKQDKPLVHDFPKELGQAIGVSSTALSGREKLVARIEEKIATLLEQAKTPFLLNKRQFNLLTQLEKQLKVILSMLDGDIQYELVSYHLRQSLEDISELTGKSVTEAAMDTVFKEFCVGK